MPRERCSKSTVQAENNQQQATKKRKDNLSLRKAAEEDGFGLEAETGDDSAGGHEDASGDINGKCDTYYTHCSSSSCCYLNNYSMEKCLLFWQEHLPQSKGVLKQ
jgi:hypothetical protein